MFKDKCCRNHSRDYLWIRAGLCVLTVANTRKSKWVKSVFEDIIYNRIKRQRFTEILNRYDKMSRNILINCSKRPKKTGKLYRTWTYKNWHNLNVDVYTLLFFVRKILPYQHYFICCIIDKDYRVKQEYILKSITVRIK